ncbi:hypothetical protein COP2_037935 [Malus domestica]
MPRNKARWSGNRQADCVMDDGGMEEDAFLVYRISHLVRSVLQVCRSEGQFSIRGPHYLGDAGRLWLYK